MHALIFNLPGIVILAVGFGLAYAIGWLFGDTREAVLMIFASPLLIAADLTYRLRREGGHWLHPWKGGMCLFLPVWVLGVVWLCMGVARVVDAGRPAGAAPVAARAAVAPAPQQNAPPAAAPPNAAPANRPAAGK